MILGVIPARGGSKGVPGKNIKMIAGKPLIAWSIEAAQKSRLLDKCIVSTEDAEIAAIAREYGAEVLDRPLELAMDESTTMSVLQHAIEHIPCDTVVVLQPTCPVRGDQLIDDCIEEFKESDYDSLATGFMCKFMEYGMNELNRQELKGFFYDDGNVYILSSDIIRRGDRYGQNMGRRYISRAENIDIDDEFDFWMAEKVLEQKKVAV